MNIKVKSFLELPTMLKGIYVKGTDTEWMKVFTYVEFKMNF